jgi:hypothetical protein
MDLKRKFARSPRFWRSALLLLLAAGLSMSLLSCDSSPDSAAVNRTGYLTISGGVKLAYDLTLPRASGRFPVALEYDDYSVGTDNSAEVAGPTRAGCWPRGSPCSASTCRAAAARAGSTTSRT